MTMVVIKTLLLAGVLVIQVNITTSCLCLLIRNFKCPTPPTCCESGQYALDECGCCLKCAKAELQTCGGASDISGRCATGLQCLKTCLPCKTVGDRGRPCIFPFKYDGETFNACTSRDSDNGQPWCATEVDSEGYVVDNSWGDCLQGCPGTRVECDDKYFSIQEGKCIDVSVPGAIPNWFGAPQVRLEEPTTQLFEAPVCRNKVAAVRLYDNTCRCARGETALDFDLQGTPRGNCTGLEDDSTDNLAKVWCFLENIRDPLNPHSGCYSDTLWSERDARFWSSLACSQAPDIETGHRFVQQDRFQSPRIPDIRGKPVSGPTTTPSTPPPLPPQPTPSPPPSQQPSEAPRSSGNAAVKLEFEENDYYYYSDVEAEVTTEDSNRFIFYPVTTTEEPEKTEEPTEVVPDLQHPPRRQLTHIHRTPIRLKEGAGRRSLAVGLRKRRPRPRRPNLADPRRNRNRIKPAGSGTTSPFPNFRRKPIKREPSPFLKAHTTTAASFDYQLDYNYQPGFETLKESPRSFLEGEFGKNNIPIAIPLFSNGELFDDIFKKIPKADKSPKVTTFGQFKITNIKAEENTIKDNPIVEYGYPEYEYDYSHDEEIIANYPNILETTKETAEEPSNTITVKEQTITLQESTTIKTLEVTTNTLQRISTHKPDISSRENRENDSTAQVQITSKPKTETMNTFEHFAQSDIAISKTTHEPGTTRKVEEVTNTWVEATSDNVINTELPKGKTIKFKPFARFKPTLNSKTFNLPKTISTLPVSFPTTNSPIFLPTISAPAIQSTNSTATLPTSSPPVFLPTINSPATLPTTSSPATLPTTSSPATLPTTSSPATLPTTSSPATLPTTSSTAILPTTSSPTTLPTTSSPAPNSPTTLPTTSSPATLPTISSPATLPTTVIPDVFRLLPTLSSMRRDAPKVIEEAIESTTQFTPLPVERIQSSTEADKINTSHTQQNSPQLLQDPIGDVWEPRYFNQLDSEHSLSVTKRAPTADRTSPITSTERTYRDFRSTTDLQTELRRAVQSSLDNLGPFILWSDKPRVTRTTSPMPVFRPTNWQKFN